MGSIKVIDNKGNEVWVKTYYFEHYNDEYIDELHERISSLEEQLSACVELLKARKRVEEAKE